MFKLTLCIDGQWIEGSKSFKEKDVALYNAKMLIDIIADNGWNINVRVIDEDALNDDLPKEETPPEDDGAEEYSLSDTFFKNMKDGNTGFL